VRVVVTPLSPSARRLAAPPEGTFTTPYGVVVPAVDRRTMRRLEQAWLAERPGGAVGLARVAGERLAAVAVGLGDRAPVRITVVAGGGWNGMAGVQAALAAAADGHSATVVQVTGRWGAAQQRATAALLRGATVAVAPAGALEAALSEADVVVDALVGGGLASGLRPWASEAVRAINRFARRIVSADLPSGLDADSGAAWGPVVRPTVTLAFGLPRVGLAHAHADLSTLLLADLRLPRSALAEVGFPTLDPFVAGPIVRLRCSTGDGGRCRDVP
jgi:ADP-dependent NAD(P)H-hydrate dehydratase / NAD(P)H-hydrate epimerase